MLKTQDVENSEDFHKYYRGQYVDVIYENKNVPFRIDSLDGKYVLGRVLLEGGKSAASYNPTWDEFRNGIGSFGIPTLGMRNTGPTVLFLYRTPERQWSRGYRPTGTSAWCPNEWDLIRANKVIPSVMDGPTVWEVFNPTYYAWNDAVSRLTGGDRIGCALNNQYAMVSLSRCPNPVIVYRRSLIGYWDDCVVLNKLFAELGPEIQQRWSVPVKVEKEAA